MQINLHIRHFARATCLVLLAAGLSAPSNGATYYRWIDQNGVTHYTSTPPQGVQAEKITGSSRNTSSSPAKQAASPAPQNVPVSAAPPAEPPVVATQDPQRCAKAQQRLAQLQSGRRLRMPTADGGFRYLNEEDIREQLETAHAVIKQSC